MSIAISNLQAAQQRAMAGLPKASGFPYLGTVPAFLAAAWRAGVTCYEVDFTERVVTYHGCNGESCVEQYPAVELQLR